MRASVLTDSKGGDAPAKPPPLPPELEARVAALESTGPGADFDGSSWFWMALIGVVIPILLLVIGWSA